MSFSKFLLVAFFVSASFAKADEANLPIKVRAKVGASFLSSTGSSSGLAYGADFHMGITPNIGMGVVFNRSEGDRGRALSRESLTVFAINPTYGLKKGIVSIHLGALIGAQITSVDVISPTTSTVVATGNKTTLGLGANAAVDFEVVGGFILGVSPQYFQSVTSGSAGATSIFATAGFQF